MFTYIKTIKPMPDIVIQLAYETLYNVGNNMIYKNLRCELNNHQSRRVYKNSKTIKPFLNIRKQ